MEEPLAIRPYDSKSKIYFEREKKLLIKKIAQVKVHHIGSTAVPGLGGKNIIDILVVVPSKRVIDSIVNQLELLGYRHRKNAGDKHRLFFNRDRFWENKKIHFHLHLMWKSNDRYKNYLRFRDYLKNHPKEARKYYLLKKQWVQKSKGVRKKYVEAKTEYVKEVLAKAKHDS